MTTPDLAYLRAHGRNREGYVRGRSLAAAAGETHITVNNKSSYAPKAAERFRRITAARSTEK